MSTAKEEAVDDLWLVFALLPDVSPRGYGYSYECAA